MESLQKIDLHLHLSRIPLPRTEQMWVSDPAEMLPHMAELGIQKAVLMSTSENSQPQMPFGSNVDNRAIAQADPSHFAWMCNLDPLDLDTIPERLATYKAEGAVGIGELCINRRLDDPLLEKIFATAGELELPITFHMSPEVGYSYGIVDDPGLPLLERALQKFPKTKFLGHSQTFWIEMSGDAPTEKEARNQWGKGSVAPGGRVPELFAKYPNLYGDLSANSAGQAILRDPAFGLEFLETYADRLFFATDMVNAGMTFPLGAWLDEQTAKGALSTQAYQKICHGNAQRVFGL